MANAWFRVMKEVMNPDKLKKMKGCACQVYLILLSHSDFDFKDSYPSLNNMADQLGLKTNKPIIRAIKNLEEIGLIKKFKQRETSDAHYNNRYEIVNFDETTLVPKTGQGLVPKTGQGYSQKRDSNNTCLNENKNNNNQTPEIVVNVTINNQPSPLEAVVVALLKKLDIDLSSTSEKFKTNIQTLSTEQMDFYMVEADKAESPSGYFVRAVEGNWQASKAGKTKAKKDRKKTAQNEFKKLREFVTQRRPKLIDINGIEWHPTNQGGPEIIVLEANDKDNLRIQTEENLYTMFPDFKLKKVTQ